MKNYFFALFLLHLVLFGFSQSNSSGGAANTPEFEVNTVYPPLSVSKEKLQAAHNLSDLNKHYPSSWVKEYVSVEISGHIEGRVRKVMGENDVLSREQKDLMNKVDVGSEIEVNVRYLPENNLKDNEEKEFNFSFMVNPEIEASYIGGEQQLREYLKVNAIDKIAEGVFTGYDLATVKFTIDEDGNVSDAHIFWDFKDDSIDSLLLEAVCNMPTWKPAEYANGLRTSQEFVLTVGNRENCIIHTLNIQQD